MLSICLIDWQENNLMRKYWLSVAFYLMLMSSISESGSRMRKDCHSGLNKKIPFWISQYITEYNKQLKKAVEYNSWIMTNKMRTPV